MRLNRIAPAPGSKRVGKRLGRGIGSGLGKTCGRGHKGQHARSGGLRKVGFEGGQMPLQRRLPKFGFRSPHVGEVAEVRLHELSKVKGDIVDIETLRAANVIGRQVRRVRVMLSGTLDRPVRLRGLRVTGGARAVIEAAGGVVED
jgi:large subunit ribosomal protein L15